jgi:hypothetical protein
MNLFDYERSTQSREGDISRHTITRQSRISELGKEGQMSCGLMEVRQAFHDQ